MPPLWRSAILLGVFSLTGCDPVREPAPAPRGPSSSEAVPTPAPGLLVAVDSATAREHVVLQGAKLDTPRRYVHFEVQARLENPGIVSQTVTNFSSIFDAFTLVVLSSDGTRTLKRIHYTYHQSPFSPGRSFPITKHNVKRLVFPTEWLNPPRQVRVFLEGTLPGSGYDGHLESNVVSVDIEAALDAGP